MRKFLLAEQFTILLLLSKNCAEQRPQLDGRHLALGLAGQLAPSQGLVRHMMNGSPRGHAEK